AAPGSRWRNFYVWSDTPERYADARIIFKDFESSNWSWDPVAKAYYWHRFYSHQPDLNFDNPEVHAAVFRAVDFWLDLGVDGLRLEMVTDEDRDYMYRVYAEDPNARINLGIRHRLAPLLKTRRKVELMNGLLFSLPGTPVLYYGDEIGMGDNIYLGDRDGVR